MNLLTLIVGVILAVLQTSGPIKISDRERAGFIGPVKKAFVEWSPVEKAFNSIAPGTRCRERTDLYDRDGRITQILLYAGECGSDEITETYRYESDGSQTEVIDMNRIRNGPPPIGNPGIDKGAGLPRTIFKYDSKGRMVKSATTRPGGTATYISTFSYDDQNRLLESRSYDQDGSIGARRVYTYEGFAKVQASYAYYDGEGKVREKIAYSDYEFNSRGDWVRRKAVSQETIYIGLTSRDRNRTSFIYRKIEYY